MTRRRPAHPSTASPATYEIRVGYVTPFLVVRAGTVDHGNVAAFHTLRDAQAHFPSAKVTEGAARKAKELGE